MVPHLRIVELVKELRAKLRSLPTASEPEKQQMRSSTKDVLDFLIIYAKTLRQQGELLFFLSF